MGSRQFSAGCLVSALPACRNTLSIRQQQQADGLHAGMGRRHPMKRPQLHPIPLDAVTFAPGTVTLTMSIGQWDALLAEAYKRGHTLLELNANEQPVAAYRLRSCAICLP